jgi:signal peptidase II
VKQRITALILAVSITLLDQLTKFLVSETKSFLQIIPGFFNIHYVENTGAAFGILQGKLEFLAIVSTIAIGVLVFLIFHERPPRWSMLIALGCILGGTCGNLIDRVRLRYVVDFLQFYITLAQKTYYWPSFNVADTFISIGVGLLIFFMLFFQEQQPSVISEGRALD